MAQRNHPQRPSGPAEPSKDRPLRKNHEYAEQDRVAREDQDRTPQVADTRKPPPPPPRRPR